MKDPSDPIMVPLVGSPTSSLSSSIALPLPFPLFGTPKRADEIDLIEDGIGNVGKVRLDSGVWDIERTCESPRCDPTYNVWVVRYVRVVGGDI